MVIRGFRRTVLSVLQEGWVALPLWRPCQALMGAVDGAEPSLMLGRSEVLQSTVAGDLSLGLREDVVQLYIF